MLPQKQRREAALLRTCTFERPLDVCDDEKRTKKEDARARIHSFARGEERRRKRERERERERERKRERKREREWWYSSRAESDERVGIPSLALGAPRTQAAAN
jgi:hypothetical protein